MGFFFHAGGEGGPDSTENSRSIQSTSQNCLPEDRRRAQFSTGSGPPQQKGVPETLTPHTPEQSRWLQHSLGKAPRQKSTC